MAEGIYEMPPGFLWGTASAAHHVEGDLTNSWSAWEMAGGHVYQDQQHGRAVEWRFGRWVEDFDRMVDLNNNTHRLSVEWSRIQPQREIWDDNALAQYSDMIDGLLERGMKPMVSLHHFTNPLWVESNGGWQNTQTVDDFVKFCAVVVEALGDRVELWCTFNEPMVYAVQAYLVGFFNPGGRNPWKMYRCAELMLRAHAEIYHTIKSKFPDAQVGVAKHIVKMEAAPPQFINGTLVGLPHRIFNDAFLDALVSGILRFPVRQKVVIPNLSGTSDYIGLNFYQRYRVALAPLSPGTYFLQQLPDPESPPPPPMWGEIYPQGLQGVLGYIWKKMRLPIYITETGTPASRDPADDWIRRWYIIWMTRQVWAAVNHNIPVKGIYYWSLLDTFEWTAGYNPLFSFGLYEVNFETQERIQRPSARLYADIAAANGLSSDIVAEYMPELSEKLFPGQPGLQEVNLGFKRN